MQTHVLTPRMCVPLFSDPLADGLHFLKASVDNAVPMPTVIDASTLAEMFGLTGTAGCFCCGLCQNVTSTARHNPRCVHYACDDPSKFGKHTHAYPEYAHMRRPYGSNERPLQSKIRVHQRVQPLVTTLPMWPRMHTPHLLHATYLPCTLTAGTQAAAAYA